MLHTREMIHNKNPTGFTIQSYIVMLPVGILGLDAGKREVNGESLVGLSSQSGGIQSSRCLGLLCMDACWADLKYVFHMFELGNSINMLMGIVEVVVTGMSKMLMPQEMLCGRTNGLHRSIVMNILMIRKC